MNNDKPQYYTLISGASAGIGKAIAIECAKNGFNLFLVSLPDKELNQTVDEIKNDYQVDVKWLGIDLTKADSPQKVFDFARENKITVCNLVNNAGIGFEGKFENLSPEVVDQMILLNVRASTMLTLFFSLK